MLDDDCRLLQEIWKNIPNVNLVEITSELNDYEDIVNEAISNESDMLIFAGHGTTNGLLFPDWNREEYILHENNVNLIHATTVICSWCYASSFCMNHNLHSFATSMFISNVNEAYDNSIYEYDQEQINYNNLIFFQQLNKLIVDNVPIDEWVMRLGIYTDLENPLDTFNRQGLILI